MKNKRKTAPSSLPVGLAFGSVVYAVALTLLIILAQWIRLPFTHALVRLCLFMPIADMICLLIALPSVTVGARVGIATADRLEKATITVNIKNRSPLPISMVKATCLVPAQNGARGVDTAAKRLFLAPFSTVTVEAQPTAYRRGRVVVGVSEVLLYDLLHLIKVRKRINGVYTLAVLPRVSNGESPLIYDGKTEEDASVTQDTFSSYDYGDVRDYRVGDSIKKIHWKLSSKSEELQVRRNVALTDSHVCIVCDRSTDSPYRLSVGVLNELDDRTVEEAMLAVSAICRNDGRGSLIIGTDDGGSLLLDFNGVADESEMRFLLSALERGENVSSFVIPESATSVYYIISYLSPNQARGVFEAHRDSASRTFNLCLRDVSDFIPNGKREEYKASLEAFKLALAQNGIPFLIVKEGGTDDEEK